MGLLNDKHSFLRAFILLVASSLLLIDNASAQDNDKIETIHVTTRVVNLNVVVTDKDGNPVTDLKKEDFTILDGGKPQKIGFFSALDNQSFSPPLSLKPDTYSNELAVSGAPPNVIILVFDNLNSAWTSQGIAINSLRKFLRKLKPQDRIGIYTLGNDRQVLKIVHDFNRDASDLIAAIHCYDEKHSHRSDATSLPAVCMDDSELNGFLNGKDVHFHYDLSARTSPAYKTGAATHARYVNRTAMQALAYQFSGVPGRKSLIWFSDSPPASLHTSDHFNEFLHPAYYTPVSSEDDRKEVERLVRLLDSVGIAMYTVDTRGLQTGTFPSAGFHIPSLPRVNGELIDLANRTGGRAFYNGNDLEVGIREALDDSRFTYSLGYYPDHQKWNNEWRHIHIKIDRPGLKVLARGGYLALSEPQKMEPKVRQVFLGQVAASPIPATQLPLNVHLVADPDQASSKFDFTVHMDPQRMLTNQDNGQWTADFEVIIFQLDDNNKVYDVNTMKVNMDVKPEDYLPTVQQGVNLSGKLQYKPGSTELCIILHDKRTDAVGSVRIPLSQYSAKLNWNIPGPGK